MRILIVMTGFFPGQKFGGPPVSVDNFCTLMDMHECYIVTRNHDMGEKDIYENIEFGWNDRGNCKVLYLSDEEYRYKKYEEVIQEIKPDIIYLQGLFQNCIIPCLALAKKNKIPVLLAPRGELCKGAFKKKYKKIPYILFLKLFRLLDHVHFQSTSEEETDSILKYLPSEKQRIHFLTNIPSIPRNRKIESEKKSGQAKLVFLSRIVAKKNLLSAIKCLSNVEGNVQFDIYGAIEDREYWDECQAEIQTLPENIKVTYKGLVSHDHVHDVFLHYDAFLFPTFSENFGHVIAEALMVGCPVIISDQTPWTDVNEAKCGWGIPLSSPELFTHAIQKVIDSDRVEELQWRQNAVKYIKKKIDLEYLKENYYTSLLQTSERDNKCAK